MREQPELRETTILLGLTVLVFLSRVPFLGTGLGMDPDAWRIVNTGHDIALTGAYSSSRSPGFPLPEMAYSLLWDLGPFVLNGATALLSALAFLFFALSLRELGNKEYRLAGLAMAFTPVIYINSTTSMDYLWALSFILGSFYLVLRHRPLMAGIFLGLAVGSRISSIIVVIPLSIFVYYLMNHRPGNVVILCASTFLVGLLTFLPVIQRYGLSFLSYHNPGYPNIVVLTYRATLGVWGLVGSCALAFFLSGQLRKRPRSGGNSAISIGRELSLGLFLAVCLCLLLFFSFPFESGYLIPAVPFAIVLLGSLLQQRHFTLVCLALIISPFFLSVDRDGIHLQGPIIREHERRVERIEFVRNIISVGNDLPEESVIVVGAHLPQIQTYLGYDPHEERKYVYLLNGTELQHYIDRGYGIYYLPELKSYYGEVYGIDLEAKGTPILAR